MSKKTVGFILGSIVGAAAGVVAGVMLAPRSGAESRAMAADAMNDAWDSAVDTYERGASVVNDKFSAVRPVVDAKTDELRAKVDLARERMDQLRDSLSDVVANASDQVKDAAATVADRVSAMADAAAPAEKAAEALAGGSKGTAAFLAGDDIPAAGTGIPDFGGRTVAADGASPTSARRSVGDALSRFKVRYHSEKAARLRGESGGILGKIHKARRSKNDAVSKVARRPIFFLAAPAAIIALVLFGMVGCSVVSSAAAGIVSIAGSQSTGQNAALNAVENQVASFFIQKGLTPLQTAAIMGNMYGESGMQPGVIQGIGVVGESYDNQTILSFGNASGLGAGLAQWDSGRRANLARYAESVGSSWSDAAVQLDYFWDHDEWSDWGGNESRRSSFLSTDDLDTAVEDFAFGWERCNPAKAHLNVRKTAAQRYYLALTVQSGSGTGQDYASATGAQKAVADAALTMGSFGASQGWCQKWVKNVYGSVGRSSASACCAHAAGDSWIVSTSSSGIPVGATVYSSRSYGNVQCTACGRDACHVGIYVGDGTVISMEDGVRARTVEEWISVYGWRGWGWNGGDDLTR